MAMRPGPPLRTRGPCGRFLQRPGAHSKICRDRPPGGQFQARLAQIAGHPAQAPDLPERMTRRQTPKLRGAGGRQKLRRQALRNPGDADQRRLKVFGATGRSSRLIYRHQPLAVGQVRISQPALECGMHFCPPGRDLTAAVLTKPYANEYMQAKSTSLTPMPLVQ